MKYLAVNENEDGRISTLSFIKAADVIAANTTYLKELTSVSYSFFFSSISYSTLAFTLPNSDLKELYLSVSRFVISSKAWTFFHFLCRPVKHNKQQSFWWSKQSASKILELWTQHLSDIKLKLCSPTLSHSLVFFNFHNIMVYRNFHKVMKTQTVVTQRLTSITTPVYCYILNLLSLAQMTQWFCRF